MGAPITRARPLRAGPLRPGRAAVLRPRRAASAVHSRDWPVTPDQDPANVFRPEIPSSARIYNYLLGGKDHYPADRMTAEELLVAVPDARWAAEQNRAFLRRAVHFLVTDLGIRQFIDIGAGLPAEGNVHEVAQRSDPAARVLYVDNDPMVIAHARNMLRGTSGTAILEHDLREPAAILADPELAALIDLAEPTAVLLVAVLHHIADEDRPGKLISELLAPLAAGSFLALSHTTLDCREEAASPVKILDPTAARAYPRSRRQVRAMLAGLELVEPGLVWAPEWRPEQASGLVDDPGRSHLYAAVGRKP